MLNFIFNLLISFHDILDKLQGKGFMVTMAGVGRRSAGVGRRSAGVGRVDRSGRETASSVPVDAACSFGSILVPSLLHKIVESKKMRVFMLVTRKILRFTQQSCRLFEGIEATCVPPY